MQIELARQVRYDTLANRELLEFLMNSPAVPERVQQLLAHVFAAQAIWLARIEGTPQPAEVWPNTPLARQGAACEELGRRLAQVVAKGQAEAERLVHYTNTKGEAFSNSVADILGHVLLHGAYHRGQIATHLRAAGLTPPATDFILFARQGKLE